MEPRRFWVREPFSGISHLVGAILSVVGFMALLILARGKPLHTVGFAIYGVSLILLYSASALYHSLPVSERHLDGLQRLDHSAIFLLIAGTYAPVCLVLLRGAWGWSLLTAEYVLAALGIVSVIAFKSRPDWLRVVLYLGMGWLALIALPALQAILSGAAMAWLLGGGILYTLGTVVYATDRPRLWPGRFGPHDLWHLFVMGGSACHFALMLSIVSAG
ncbi:MAG TPA: hemolysin III family protein [Chthonomonadaceae bacterium]|nr:hemolysin III family protein [Chthonomonadaceae bacterium]